ncbi:hypothetical protein GCM10028805_65150 [Spirosoma harenae]
MQVEAKKFRILSLDGGGIRGLFSLAFLVNIEAEMQRKGINDWQIYKHFDLICGTSTGGIIAIALALGIPASEVYELYYDNAKEIFGNKKGLIRSLFSSSHKRNNLEKLVRDKFKSINNDVDPRLADCKTNICITIYDLLQGKPSVLKNKYHADFVRDYHIPAYQAALATSAAPTYFDPYSSSYTDLKNVKQNFSNKVDGGVFANNPTLIGIIEAQKAFSKNLADLSVLSIGTGHMKFLDACNRKRWGYIYWLINRHKKRIIELFMQGQSQQVQNLISLLHKGIGQREIENFIYMRIDTELDETCNIELDETDSTKLNKLSEKANIEYQKYGAFVVEKYFQ